MVLRFQQVREGPAIFKGDVVRTDLTVLRVLSTTSFGLCSKFNAQAAQKPYSSTGAGLVLRGSNSKWYQVSP